MGGMECQMSSTKDDAKPRAVCSKHGKIRSVDVMEDDGQGGKCCSEGMACKSQGDEPGPKKWGKGGWTTPQMEYGGWQMVWVPKGSGKKGKGKGGSIICEDMKKYGECSRGEECKWCQKMWEKFGTNDPNDPTCWNMKMKGVCRAGDKCKWQH